MAGTVVAIVITSLVLATVIISAVIIWTRRQEKFTPKQEHIYETPQDNVHIRDGHGLKSQVAVPITHSGLMREESFGLSSVAGDRNYGQNHFDYDFDLPEKSTDRIGHI